MSNTYILIAVLIMCWTLNPFMKKHASKNLTSDEYMIFNHGLCTILIIIYFIYLLMNNKCDINCIKKIDKKQFIYSIGGAVTTVFAALVLIKLLKNNNASSIIPQIQPIVIISTVSIGYFIFKEDITKNKILGCMLIVFGLFVFNRKNDLF